MPGLRGNTSVFCALSIILVSACADDSPPGDQIPLDVSSLTEVAVSNSIDSLGPSADGTNNGEETKQSPDSDTEPDVEEPVCPGGFECPCEENSDCESGYCVPSNNGSICTDTCITECPEGYLCKAVPGADVILLCVPVLDMLCAPCTDDSECGDLGGRCLLDASGEGRCGRACSVGNACPDDYTCKEIEPELNQCVHVSGQCPCSKLLAGTTKSCVTNNEFGSCKGQQVCTSDGWGECDAAAAELERCDNNDNDCDGEVDEDFPELGQSCDSDTDEDLCANGVWSCSNDTLSMVCGEDTPAKEQCDGIDNNCDSVVDEGFVNSDGDEFADCVDDDDDGDGDPDATDCESLDPLIFTGAKELCDGVDQDCDGIVDNGFADLNNNGIADCMDEDLDGDGVPNDADNCVEDPNSNQDNLDGDAQGDVCDPDDDNDGVLDEDDLCPLVADPEQLDNDNDGTGDECDPDDDNDGTADELDCEPLDALSNPTAVEVCDGVDNNCNGNVDEGFPDTDQDKLADCLDGDDDNDGALDENDCMPKDALVFPGQKELCNAVDDDCNDVIDDGWPDTDADGVADCLDEDDDSDGVPDNLDNCPNSPNPDQANSDDDLAGDACDTDDDGDGALDDKDCAPKNAAVFPNAKEVCDGVDNNCNNDVDEGFPDSDDDGLADCLDKDDDGDGVPDNLDNCPTVANPNQKNSDTDLVGNACDSDDDNDDSLDIDDCEPTNPLVFPNNKESCDGIDNNCNGDVDEGFPDSNNDGEADCVSDDDDGDGIPDAVDNCKNTPNPDQKNSDGDLLGDACDTDDDNDGSLDDDDCAPLNKEINPNAEEACDGIDNNCNTETDEGFDDTDDNGLADCIDADDDGDGVPDNLDNCPKNANPGQTNSDNDLIGNACDTDDDNDGTPDLEDCEPTTASINPSAKETCDGIDNNCNQQVDEGFPDTDNDGTGDCIDLDDDNDGIPDSQDNCSLIANPDQINSDSDLVGDACDSDDDNDGDPDNSDCQPKNPAINSNAVELCDSVDNNCNDQIDEGFVDTDSDGVPDCTDPDDDGDFVVDPADNCPLIANPSQTNSDSDLLGDACDPDDDNDGDLDPDDCQPKNPAVFSGAKELCDGVDNDCSGTADDGFDDTDGDGLADCVDPNDDNDPDLDEDDCAPLDSTIHSQADEVCGNGKDDDCNADTNCFTVTQGNKTVEANPFPGTKGVLSWYSYGKPKGASANTGLETSQGLMEFLYEDPTDNKLYLIIIVDRFSDSGGGKATINLSGADGASLVLMDDPGEGGNKTNVNPDTGTGTLIWTWASCCTDGAIVGPLTPPFCTTLSLSNASGLNKMYTMDGKKKVTMGGPGTPVTICAQP